ncbi:MAG TPA: DUF4349 domain-containing protein [Acidimicrobiales bacterium]|nr:DUF4349 domain-containing protein [Acidimicrobiales bacterium]
MNLIEEKFVGDVLENIASCIRLPDGAVDRILASARIAPDCVEEVANNMADAALGDEWADEIRDIQVQKVPQVTPSPRTRKDHVVRTLAGARAERYFSTHRRLSFAAAAVCLVVVASLTYAGFASTQPRGTQSSSGSILRAMPNVSHSASTAGPSVPSSASASSAGSTGLNSSTNQQNLQANSSLQQSKSASAGQSFGAEFGSSTQGSPANAPSTTQGAVPSVTPDAIEKTGSVSLSVSYGTFDNVMNRLTGLASGSGGFVSDTQTQKDLGLMTGTRTLEVPVNTFESVLNQVRSVGSVQSVSTKATDVTGQVVDLASRIQALQESLTQYEKILSQANSIGDILSVQSQIDSIQTQIEQLQGQQNLLNAVTLYSTLSVSVSESPAIGHHALAPKSPPSGLGLAWHDTISGFTGAFDGLVSIAGPLFFAVLCLVALIAVGRLTWRAARRWLL